MVDRYHLLLGCVALGIGVVLALLDLLVVPAVPPRRSHPLGPAVLPFAVVSVAAIWSAVPDTEPAVVVLGVLVPCALGRWSRRTTVGPIGCAAVCVAGAVAAVLGAAGRVGPLSSVCALGAVVLAPVQLGFGRRTLTSRDLGVVAAAQVGLAVVVRTTVHRSAPVAWTMALAGLGVVGLLLAVTAGRAAGGDGDERR